MRRRAIAIMLSFLAFAAFAQEALPVVYRFSIGSWLLRETGGYADWLGLKYRGKYLREPINVVIVDPFADSSETAIAKVVYLSFTRARDDFCACMDARTGYRIQGRIDLGNTESGGELTTGDHDGRATVLIATE